MADETTPPVVTTSGTWSPVFKTLSNGNYEVSRGTLALAGGLLLLVMLTK